MITPEKSKSKSGYKIFFVLGITFLPIGIATNPAFMVIGIVFMIIGMAGMSKARKEAKEASEDSEKR